MSTETRLRERRWVLRLAAGVTLCPVLVPAARGQDDAPKGRPEGGGDGRRRLERWNREMAEYTIAERTDPEAVLRLKPEPVLHWSNPVRDADDGLVFLWLAGNRPRAVVCIFRAPWQRRMLETHEFQSLSTGGMTATRRERTVWSPPAAGVAWRPVPGAARPAATPAERLRQLREMAREFHASVDVDKQRTELRLLSQPVYRYEAGAAAGSDGALFVFALTTDPEAWLLIEERPGEGGPAWHYAFGRMTSHSLSASHRDRPVWEVAHEPNDTNPSGTYCRSWSYAPVPEP
jgi:hypothetical protein